MFKPNFPSQVEDNSEGSICMSMTSCMTVKVFSVAPAVQGF